MQSSNIELGLIYICHGFQLIYIVHCKRRDTLGRKRNTFLLLLISLHYYVNIIFFKKKILWIPLSTRLYGFSWFV